VNRLSLKVKLGMGFGVLLLIIIALSAIAYQSAVRAGELSDQIERQGEKKDMTFRIDLSVEQQIGAVRAFVPTGDEAHLASGERARVTFRENMEKLENLLQTEAGKKSFATVQQQYGEYRPILDHVIQIRRAGNAQEALDLLFSPETNRKRNELRENIHAMVELIDRLKKAAEEEQSISEARTKNVMLGLACAGVLISIGVTFVIVRSIAVATSRMLAIIQEIANKNLTVEDMKITSEDEIGQAGIALNQMKNGLHTVIQSIASAAAHVGSASDRLSGTSQQITANSEETSAQANVVANASAQVNQNLQTVATGAEEMGASIKEIAKNASEAAKIATSAVRVAETTTATVSKLGESSSEIGQVIKVITSIAQQTNLLALNATIEAARAGEAGKGFAVVANEVKELAKETAKATEDISRKIVAIQTDTKAAVEAIASISGVIHQINDISSTIATAVEEQNATTNEMSRNVSEAAHGSGEITSNIGGVAEAAESTTRGAADTQKASEQLVGTAAELRRLVAQFKISAGPSQCGESAAASQPDGRAAHAGWS